MTFLSVYTPTYRRPRLLEQCRRSVISQTSFVEHVIVPDEIGIGIAGVYADVPKHKHLVNGDYVMVLSDDNILLDDTFAEDLEIVARQSGFPAVIIFKGEITGFIQPMVWEAEPEISCIDLSCFAVRRLLWQHHATDWGHRYEGDFDFIHKLWEEGYRFHWWDRIGFRALQISNGAPE